MEAHPGPLAAHPGPRRLTLEPWSSPWRHAHPAALEAQVLELIIEPLRLTLETWSSPCAMEAHPGAVEAHPGAMKAHPGSHETQESHPGAMEAHPGVVEAHPGQKKMAATNGFRSEKGLSKF